jgi:tetratricopeptide (TPR) repeat protein
MQRAEKAFRQGDYDDAENSVEAALEKAEQFGPEDPRLAASLNNLAFIYHVQGRYADAEPLYRRALVIVEKVLGPHHPNVATAMENYAALLRKTNRSAEAEKLEERAKAIWSGESEETPQNEKKKME